MDQYISSFTADMIGFAGSFLIVAAFAYSNVAARMNILLFNVLNLVGAALLTVSLTVNFNLPTMVLEIVWMAIAIFGIVKALRDRGGNESRFGCKFMIIAVDGPTASGKGTVAKQLARHFDLPFLDTGLLYRAVGRQVALNKGDADNASDALAACDFPDSLLDDAALRDEATGSLASRVSVHPNVRAALNKRQVDFAQQARGAVLDGRDIGTVIAPDADAKLFITASAEVRAQRRYEEMAKAGGPKSYDQMLVDIIARDERDSTRAEAPLKPAEDALLLDTSDLTIGDAVQRAIALVDAQLRSQS